MSRKEWTIGRTRFVFVRKPSTKKGNAWGRFGGGWDWELGFQIGGRTLILNLLVASLRISRKEKTK